MFVGLPVCTLGMSHFFLLFYAGGCEENKPTPFAGFTSPREDSPFSSGSIPVTMLSSSNGPQLGVYAFDYSGSWPSALHRIFGASQNRGNN